MNNKEGKIMLIIEILNSIKYEEKIIIKKKGHYSKLKNE
jgi:hypothetical protein